MFPHSLITVNRKATFLIDYQYLFKKKKKNPRNKHECNTKSSWGWEGKKERKRSFFPDEEEAKKKKKKDAVKRIGEVN